MIVSIPQAGQATVGAPAVFSEASIFLKAYRVKWKYADLRKFARKSVDKPVWK
jgi:hypothetical protein